MVLPTLPYKWIGVALVGLLAVAAVFFAIRAYGDARYDAGVADTDARWIAAGEKLEQESEASANAADAAAEARTIQFNDALAEEKEKIDEAIAAGADPLDVLFPSGGVPD